MAEFYSERHGRTPSLDVDGLIQFVLRKFADFERDGYFWDAFHSYEIHGEEHDARVTDPEQYVITTLGRPGLWKWLGDTERVVAEEDFPTWDRDTLYDVIELFHNEIVAAPILDADETFEGYSRTTGQRDFRQALNKGLERADPSARLTEEGQIVETAPDRRESEKESSGDEVLIVRRHEEGNKTADDLAASLRERGFRISLVDHLTEGADPGGSRVAVLGPEFAAGNWTRAELDLLAQREPRDGREPIIVVSQGIDADQVRAVDPHIAERGDLSIELGGIDPVVDGIARALRRNGVLPNAEKSGSLFGWFVKHKDPLLIGLLLAFVAAALKWGPELLDHHSGGTTTVVNEGGDAASEGPVEEEARAKVVEYSDNTAGSPVFANPKGAPVGAGQSGVIPYETRVVVSCFAEDQSGMESVSGFYRIASREWKGDYVVADTMTNGGPVGNTDTPNVDPRVKPCTPG
jgi:hypothetical protein